MKTMRVTGLSHALEAKLVHVSLKIGANTWSVMH